MHISELQLRVRPGTGEDVVAYYRQQGILDAADCLWSHLAIDDSDPDVVLVITGWSDEAQMTRWHSDPRRAEASLGLAAWVSSVGDVSSRSCRVRLSAALAPNDPNTTLDG